MIQKHSNTRAHDTVHPAKLLRYRVIYTISKATMQPTAKIMPLYVAKHCFTLLQRNNRLCRHRAALLFNVSIAVLLRVPSASNSNRDKSHEFHRTLFPRTITRGTIARCIMPITCVTQHETKWFPLRVKAKT